MTDFAAAFPRSGHGWIVFGIAFGSVVVAVTLYSLWAKYLSHGPYRGRRIINWTKSQRDESREWTRERHRAKEQDG